jgi:membrane-bound ClpP family serine protease
LLLMEILVLSTLLVIGLILLLVEILFIPGTTVVGIFGFLVSLAGLAFAFLNFDYSIAIGITGVTLVINFAAVWYGFSSGIWKKFSLKSTQSGGAFDGRTDGLEVGMKGLAVSDIKPYGKASFNEIWVEVKSESGFIEVNTPVTITKIENNKISVN